MTFVRTIRSLELPLITFPERCDMEIFSFKISTVKQAMSDLWLMTSYIHLEIERFWNNNQKKKVSRFLHKTAANRAKDHKPTPTSICNRKNSINITTMASSANNAEELPARRNNIEESNQVAAAEDELVEYPEKNGELSV